MLRDVPRGRDSGIDLRCSCSPDRQTVVQCKHWMTSGTPMCWRTSSLLAGSAQSPAAGYSATTVRNGGSSWSCYATRCCAASPRCKLARHRRSRTGARVRHRRRGGRRGGQVRFALRRYTARVYRSLCSTHATEWLLHTSSGNAELSLAQYPRWNAIRGTLKDAKSNAPLSITCVSRDRTSTSRKRPS